MPRLCRRAYDSCYKCLRLRLIQKRKYTSAANYTFPRDYHLSLSVSRISQEINKTWQLGIVPRIAIKNSYFSFVDKKLNETYKNVSNAKIYCNIFVFVNCRTSFTHFEILYSRKFHDIRICIETFLHKFGISSCTLITDQEMAIIKLAKHQGNPVSFFTLCEGTERDI